MDWKNVLKRAAWTFLEGFVVAFPVGMYNGVEGIAWKSILLSTAMAAVSALKTTLVELIQKHNEDSQD